MTFVSSGHLFSFSKGFRDNKTHGMIPYIFRMEADWKIRMSINFTVDEENQIIHLVVDKDPTIEEFYKFMPDVMASIFKFDKPKMLINYNIIKGPRDSIGNSIAHTFKFETIRHLKKMAIYSPYERYALREALDYCRNEKIPCKNFDDIEHANVWLKAE